MDERLNREEEVNKQSKLLIEVDKEQDITKNFVKTSHMPPAKTQSKEAGKRMEELRKNIWKAADYFKTRYKDFASGMSGGKKKEKRSDTAKDLMDCLFEMNEQSTGEVVFKDDVGMQEPKILEKLFALSQAADNYYVTHKKKVFATAAGEQRFLTAKQVREMTSQCLNAFLSEKDKEEIYNNEDAFNVLGEDAKTIEKDLKQAAKAYRKYRVSLAENCMGYMPGGETLHRKLRVLRASERLIRIYRRDHPDETKWDKLISEMIHDYEECLGWEKLRTLTKQKEESFDELIDEHLEKETEYKREEVRTVPADSREGLNEEQIKGIEKIDNWLIKNYKAGSNEDMEMLDRLFSLPKRERLHIYYLIEMKRRRNANMLDVAVSQAYTPTLEGFKDKMLATKFKFWKRLGGDYFYTHKLSDALLVTREYRKEIENVAEMDHEQKRLKKEEEKDDLIRDPAAKAMDKLLELRGALQVLCEEWKKRDAEKTEREKARHDYNINEAREKCRNLALNLRDLQTKVPKEKVYMDQGESRSEGTYDTAENYSIFGYLPNIVSEEFLGGAFEMGTSGVLLLISAITSSVLLAKNGKNYSREDVAEQSMVIGFSAGYAAASGVMIAGKFAQSALLTQTATVLETGLPVVGGLVTAGVAICQGVAARKMESHGETAASYFKLKREKMKESLNQKGQDGLTKEQRLELKYEINMQILQNQLTMRQTEKTATTTVAAGFFIGGTVLPILLLPALAAFIVGSVRQYKTASNMQNALFDRFFNMDELAGKAWKQRLGSKGFYMHRGSEDEEEMKERMKGALRLRIAARAGFNSVKRATEYICSRFARLIRKKLFPEKEPENQEQKDEQKGYIELVKALNLRYDAKKKLPEEHILARRLNAQG